MLQIGSHNAPAPPQITVHAVFKNISECLVRILGLDKTPVGVTGIAFAGKYSIRVAKPHRLKDFLRQFVKAESRISGLVQRVEQCRTQEANFHKIIEMARLQGGILPVVGKAQEFPGNFLQIRLCPQMIYRGHGQYGGSRAASFCPQSSQLGKFAKTRIVRNAALRTKHEWSGKKPRGYSAGRWSALHTSIRMDMVEDRNILLPVLPYAENAAFFFQPVFRQSVHLFLCVFRPRIFTAHKKIPDNSLFNSFGRRCFCGIMRDKMSYILFLVLDQTHAVVFLAAFAAEAQGIEQCFFIITPPGSKFLPEKRYETFFFLFNRSVNCISLAQKLMELESKNGLAGFGLSYIASSQKSLLEPFFALRGGDAGELGKSVGKPLFPSERPRAATHKAAIRLAFSFLYAQIVFNPDHKRITDKFGIGIRQRRIGGNTFCQGMLEFGQIKLISFCFGGKRFHNDVFCLNFAAEQLGGYVGNFLLLLGKSARACQRCRCADALERVLDSSKGNAQATDQHSHVRALSATIGMQFVKYKKLQIGSGLYQLALIRPGQDQFQHYIVGQENIRRIIKNFLSGLFSFLPGISAESYGERAACFQKFVQLQFL